MADRRRLNKMAAKAEEQHSDRIELVLQEAKAMLDASKAEKERKTLRRIVDQLSIAGSHPSPGVPPEAYNCLITGVTLAAPVEEFVQAKSQYRLATYIDLQIRVEKTTSLTLSSGVPYSLVHQYFGDDSEGNYLRSTIDPKMLDFDGRVPPQWSVHTEEKVTWVDVRPDLSPIGEVMRELKALRALADPDTSILVVHADRDELGQSMLANEGFIAIAEEDLPPVPSN